MNLEVLLERELSIKNRISEALKSIKTWFEKKIDDTKEILEKAKDKVKEFLSKLKNTDLDIINSNIEVEYKDKTIEIVKEGDTGENALNKIRRVITKFLDLLKTLCIKIITVCKEAIKGLLTIEKIDHEAELRKAEEEAKRLKEIELARERKEKVMSGLQDAAVIVTTISAIVIGVSKIYSTVKDIKKNK